LDLEKTIMVFMILFGIQKWPSDFLKRLSKFKKIISFLKGSFD